MPIVQLLGGVRASIFALLLVIMSIFYGVTHYKYEAYKTGVQASRLAAERMARAKEEGWRAGIEKWVRDYANKRKLREEHLQSVIADLHNGSIRVRKRLSCPASPSPGSDGGEGSGLSTEDAEFLLREGARADALAEQLRLLQEYVKEITGG